MQIIDTHSHIYQPDFDEDIDDVIKRAQAVGVEKILLPNIDVSTIDRLHNLCTAYPSICFPMMGLHPTSVSADWQSDLKIMKEYFDSKNFNYIAIGEIGVDLYWDKTLQQEQCLAFMEQLGWSIEYDLPVVIHSRDSNIETVDCVKEVGAKNLRGVFHSFAGSEEELERILNLENFLLGINGVVTFKNSTLSTVLKQTDLTKIIIETDAPYLAPVPYRGKRNESSYTKEIVQKLSEIFLTSPEEVARITTKNAEKLFGLNRA